MTPSVNLIDEIEDALASKTEEKREAALWRITDLFIEGSDTYTEDHVTLFDDVEGNHFTILGLPLLPLLGALRERGLMAS